MNCVWKQHKRLKFPYKKIKVNLDLLQWCKHQTLQGRFVDPMILVGLPSSFSEQAKFDREKGFHPIRITFQAEGEDNDNLLKNWPDYRIPKGFSDEEDLDAEGKYNHELYQAQNLIKIDSSSSEISSVESEDEEVDDYVDGPLMEF